MPFPAALIFTTKGCVRDFIIKNFTPVISLSISLSMMLSNPNLFEKENPSDFIKKLLIKYVSSNLGVLKT